MLVTHVLGDVESLLVVADSTLKVPRPGYGRGAVTEHVAFYPPVPDGPEDLTNAR